MKEQSTAEKLVHWLKRQPPGFIPKPASEAVERPTIKTTEKATPIVGTRKGAK